MASLQSWTEDLDPVTLGTATERVYSTFFYSSTSHTLCQQSDETLFGYFVKALNEAFNQQLLLADEGYKSGSDTIDLPTLLRKTPCIHHISSREHTSFNPVLTTPHSYTHKHHPDQCADAYLLAQQTTAFQTALKHAQTALDDEEEEDFQMVSLDDEHWTSEETPDRTLCIHKHGLPHGLCQYPCPYMNYNSISYMDSWIK